jgi:hypothetical protein
LAKSKPYTQLIMAETKNKKVASSREKLLSRARERFPDRNFADLPEDTGTQDGQEGVDDLDDAINEMIEAYAADQETFNEKDSRLKELLVSDPSSAEFIAKWVETGDPRTALVEVFGDELGIGEEAQAQFKEQLEGWRSRKEANDALQAESETNWDNSLAALEEWGNAKNLSLEQKRDVMLRLLAITSNGMVNKYGADDFDLAYKAINHDNDVNAAREEGEVAGRNAKIAAARRDRGVSSAMPPSRSGGQGVNVTERQPVQENTSPWAGVR